jgi:hypothetical protein
MSTSSGLAFALNRVLTSSSFEEPPQKTHEMSKARVTVKPEITEFKVFAPDKLIYSQWPSKKLQFNKGLQIVMNDDGEGQVQEGFLQPSPRNKDAFNQKDDNNSKVRRRLREKSMPPSPMEEPSKVNEGLKAAGLALIGYPCWGLFFEGVRAERTGLLPKETESLLTTTTTVVATNFCVLYSLTTSLVLGKYPIKNASAILFIRQNLNALAKESARRDGEFLQAFLETLSLNERGREHLVDIMAANHTVIFSDRDPENILDRILLVSHQYRFTTLAF